MRVRKTPRSIRTCVTTTSFIAIAVAITGCTFQVLPDDSGHTAPPVPVTTITVKAVNETDRPLDPQLFVGPIADGVENLFVVDNKRTDFGVGGVGILLPGDTVSFAVACDDQVFIATQGGIFGEDLTTPDGKGRQYVLEEEVNVDCGDQVTFSYANDGNVLQTRFSVRLRNN